MSVSAAITANQILTRVAVEVGLEPAQDPFGSQDEKYVQLKMLLQIACEDLCLAAQWEFLTKEFNLVSTNIPEYILPEDFSDLVSMTGWDRDNDEPVRQLTPQQWRQLEASGTEPTQTYFRIMHGKIAFMPVLEPGRNLSFEYQSLLFALDKGDPDRPVDTIGNGSDIVLFDRTLISRYLKTLWLEAKGLDSTSAQDSFNQVFQMVSSKDKGGETLNASSVNRFRLLTSCNVNDGRFGL